MSRRWRTPTPLAAPAYVPRPAASQADLELERDSPITTLLAELIAARTADMTIAEAIKMPPVRRAVDLIISTGSQFAPRVFADRQAVVAAQPADTQPLGVTRPDPASSLFRFVGECLASLVFDGEIVLQRLGRGARVLPLDEVEIVWDARRLFRVYSWRGTPMPAGSIVHVMIGDTRPGRERGSSPLRECLAYLAPLKAAEDYALAFFSAGGIPDVVIKVAAAIDKNEADALKQQWIESRTGPDPAVLGGGAGIEFPAIDPESAQMLGTRGQGTTIVARMMGIPAPLLHVETTGATITYTNADGAILALVKATVYPLYLRAVEDALEQIIGGSQLVRFVTAADKPLATLLEPVDIAGRPREPAPGPGRPPGPAREEIEDD